MEENIVISDLISKLQSMKERYGDLPIATINTSRITNSTNYVNSIRMSAVITNDHKDDHLLLIIK